MNVVRLIVVKVNPAQAKEAENIWKQHCAPLMIKEPGCVSEKLLRCTDEPGEFISYSEWQDQQSIEKYRTGKAHAEIKRHSDSLKGERPVVKRYEIV
jgi:quinol monooxygenase YgiN